MSLPRLTGALRVFAALSPADELNIDVQEKDIVEKREFEAKKRSQDGLTWQAIGDLVHKHAKADKKTEIVPTLRQLYNVTKDIVGGDGSTETLEGGAALLFDTFKASENVSHKESSKLRGIFGPFPASAASKACNLVNRIISWLPEETVEELNKETSDEPEDSAAEFGKGIKFNLSEDLNEDEEYVSEDSDEEETEFDLKYSQVYDEKAGKSKIKRTKSVDTGWLKNEVEKYFGKNEALGLSILDMCSTLFDTLSSSKSDSELQNDLFEFLGFERFELIESLLQNRQKVIAVTMDTAVETFLNAPQAMGKGQGESAPIFGCQVTVQSEEEKQLRKLMRKEEKKMARKRGEDIEDQEEYLMALGFDPKELRAKREAALLAASTRPLFPQRNSAPIPQQIQYPFVFDALAEARQSAAFVGGAKLMLPLNFEREQDGMYEEVNIPHTSQAPAEIGKRLVPIASLDEIGQLAFKGMKNLNRIQSVVFETAYRTNENLLICAPTGAGKTNIAMLTILHEIKQHISQGVIKKDEFKVIYVAPMKALAAEMVRNFGKRLEPLGISVRELTGDMQLTKSEILKTQMLVTTPEKWDVVTRKSTGDVALAQLVKLIIIDEIHLLHDGRGAVIESLVARTLRQVETSQSMIRIVGLSATLPNYLDVATFLHVNPFLGLFFFDGRFRPVPLGQTFIGVKATNVIQQIQDMNYVCYEKVLQQVRNGEQVMVFVHARNETVRTAMLLREMANNKGHKAHFAPAQGNKLGEALKQISKSRNRQLRELFPDGFGTHHAGMLRQDRNLVERYFADGHIKVLVCTATLAWGVNLPAHAVIIKGTNIYDAKKGAFVDLGILDVMQIFGRAGRPQFDQYGHGTIITTHNKLSHYLSLLTRQNPIESQFINSLTDNLNAEISLGTVTNVEEAVKWLSYTYLYVRMRYNPLAYGISITEAQEDPGLDQKRRDLILTAGRSLDKSRMVRFEERTGYFSPTDLGRTSSHFYIKYDTVEVFNEHLKTALNEGEILGMVSKSQEFEQIKVREEEMTELEGHLNDSCVMAVPGGIENTYGKVNILLQTYVSRVGVDCFSLVSDMSYVAQNAARIIRALFEVVLRKGWPTMAARLLNLSKVVDKRLWGFESPMRQFPVLGTDILNKLENRKLTIDKLKEMDAKEIGHMIHHVRMGAKVKQFVHQIPQLILEANIQPITRTVLRVRLDIKTDFRWDDKIHGGAAESFWIWVEDPENNHIYHSEYFLVHKKHVQAKEPQEVVFTIPIFEPLPTQYYVRAISDRWLGSETTIPISFQHLILPERHPPHTDLLDLQPLPLTALQNSRYEALYKFTHYNPIQTQIFHTLYHSDGNVLLGAPTGSGKTIAAEMAIFRVFNEYPKMKSVYIAPLKALVRERIDDWKIRIEKKLGKKVVELTGDVTPDMRAVAQADLIVTTPEKWDGISRSWQNRSYVKDVALLVIDEIHLLGEERGPVLEVIVSRTNYISSHTDRAVRVVGLSTALANARDLADWLNIKNVGLFNFRPSVRPVPLEVHISGFPGKHYCPRMATMNKPTYQAIRTHSPLKPVLIFVSSRRQTRLTALDLIAFLAAEDNPKQWLHTPEIEIENIILGVKDTNLRLTLAFGIGIHHAGLHERDRKFVEELFCNQKIQVLIATSTLAWGVNFPAHLVVIKGTEYFDGKIKRYKDFPVTDVLQMMGRAGRPQFDDQGTAVILVHDIKKHFYKKFLYEPFPVESCLLDVLAEHLNAEVVAGTITSKQQATDYITWTYFFRRLVMNPSYYELDDTDHDTINKFLSKLVEKALFDLECCYCLEIAEDNRTIEGQTLGTIASYYYLHHTTVRTFKDELAAESTIPDLIEVLSKAHEYSELPVRHNEDQTNSELSKKVPLEMNPHTMDSSHTKTNILLQAHFSNIPLPSTDYFTDTKSVLDQAIRILQAMLDVTAEQGWLVSALRVIHIVQMVVQGLWWHDNTLLCLPHIEPYNLYCFSRPKPVGGAIRKKAVRGPIECLPQLMEACDGNYDVLLQLLEGELDQSQIDQIYETLQKLPQLGLRASMSGWWEDGPGKQEKRPIPLEYKGGRRTDSDWLRVHADQEYVLNVTVSRLNRMKKRDRKAHCPRFPKQKDEGWFAVLAEVETKDLITMKRVSYIGGSNSFQLAFYSPPETGRVIFTLYFMSDSYLGLDQQYDIPLEIIPASIEAQVNSEIKDSDLDGLIWDDDISQKEL